MNERQPFIAQPTIRAEDFGPGHAAIAHYEVSLPFRICLAIKKLIQRIFQLFYQVFTGEFDKYKKLVRITWPVWFYVAVTGVIVYWMISPYYG